LEGGEAESGREIGFETADPVGGVTEEWWCCSVRGQRTDEHRSLDG
jgi:hypothetical protein